MHQKNKHLTNWASRNFHIFAYQKNNLVYVPSMKAASTYYVTLCVANDFERIPFETIDWEHNHVVGFIMEPIKRYFKGLVEDIIQCEDTSYYDIVYKMLDQFNSFSFPVSGHCMPITRILSNYAYLIDWIPLYEPNIPSHELFLKLCQHHDIIIDDKDPTIDPHHSSPYKMDFFNKIYQLADKFSDNNSAWFMNIAEDLELYYNVVAKINPSKQSWKDISWLNKPEITIVEDHNWPSLIPCTCQKCLQGTKKDIETITIGAKTFLLPTRQANRIRCPDCGDSSCFKAKNHYNNCINTTSE